MGRWFREARRSTRRPFRRPAVPRVEALEDRCLLSGGYLLTNLVSDLPGIGRFTDPSLLNPWGLAAGPTGPFWVADAYAGAATLYDGAGRPARLVVNVPPDNPADSTGAPTGVVFNGGPDFVISADGRSAPGLFLFATEEGTIAAWSPDVDLAHTLTVVDNSAAGAVYKGLALGTDSRGRALLYAADFATGSVDVFDSSFHAVPLAGAFTDPNLPAGFAPFGIQDLGGSIFVTYALQDAKKADSVPGPGNGFLDVYSTDGVFERRLVSQGPLDSPWGLALASAGFGPFSRALLVGNTGDGRINAFDPQTGRFLGALTDDRGQPITIENLWGLSFGNGAGAGSRGTLYFTAGIGDEEHGLFGEIRAPGAKPDAGNGTPGEIYGAPAPGQGQDDYPLPPATGPTVRGDVVVQPRALPLLVPLKEPGPAPAPAVLALTDGSSRPATGTVPAPGTPPPSVWASSTAGTGATDASGSERVAALDILLSPGMPAAGGEVASHAQGPTVGPDPTLSDNEPTGALVMALAQADDGATASPAPGPRRTSAPPGLESPAAVPADIVAGPDRKGQQPAPRVWFPLAALLVVGLSFPWGIGYVAGRWIRQQGRPRRVPSSS